MLSNKQRKSFNPKRKFLPIFIFALFASLISALSFVFIYKNIAIAMLFFQSAVLLGILVSSLKKK